MNKTLLKWISSLLFPFDRRKRMLFRGKHDPTAAYTRKLKKRGVEIGFGSYVYEGTKVRDKHSKIGRFCSIGPGVHIGTGRHPMEALSTNTMVHKICYTADGEIGISPENQVAFEQTLPVLIGNDVWIGMNAVIMDGITIGDGAVVGAGAIVTKDVPPYAIVAGIPARVIRYRFDEQTITRLLRTRWWEREMAEIRELPAGNVEKSLALLEERGDVRK